MSDEGEEEEENEEGEGGSEDRGEAEECRDDAGAMGKALWLLGGREGREPSGDRGGLVG